MKTSYKKKVNRNTKLSNFFSPLVGHGGLGRRTSAPPGPASRLRSFYLFYLTRTRTSLFTRRGQSEDSLGSLPCPSSSSRYPALTLQFSFFCSSPLPSELTLGLPAVVSPACQLWALRAAASLESQTLAPAPALPVAHAHTQAQALAPQQQQPRAGGRGGLREGEEGSGLWWGTMR